MDGLFHGKPLIKWMIWGFPHYFWKHPYPSDLKGSVRLQVTFLQGWRALVFFWGWFGFSFRCGSHDATGFSKMNLPAFRQKILYLSEEIQSNFLGTLVFHLVLPHLSLSQHFWCQSGGCYFNFNPPFRNPTEFHEVFQDGLWQRRKHGILDDPQFLGHSLGGGAAKVSHVVTLWDGCRHADMPKMDETRL